jgi:UDP-N-acetylmuramyl pentapeptide synthase
MQKIFNQILSTKDKYNCNIVFDTRNLKANDIFIGLKTKNIDGSFYFKDAIKKGAKLLIINNKKANNKNIIHIDDTDKFILNFCKFLLKLYQGKIISITGSVGKTTIKENIYHILKNNNYLVSRSYKNFNNLLGLQFSIMNMNLKTDFSIFELGINAPGEMKPLINLLNPHFSLVTCIENSHIGNFKNFDDLINNKIKIFKSKKLISGLINFTHVKSNTIKNLKSNIKVVNINNLKYSVKSDKKQYLREFNYLNLKRKIISEFNGLYEEISIISYLFLSQFIKKFNSKIFFYKNSIIETHGNILNKIYNGNKIKIFDHSYNSSPYSLKKQLFFFNQRKLSKKLCIIGSMKELGENSINYHIEIINMISLSKINKTIFIGEEFYKIRSNFKKYNFYKSYKSYLKFMKNDFITFKNIFVMGSRSNQLNRIIEKI